MATILDPVNLWKDLHAMPELGMKEYKTAEYIRNALTSLGIEWEAVGETGTVGYIRGREAGPTVLFRADIDALPFKIDGQPCAIHACGHDSHAAMLLATASRLVGEVKKGTLKLCFQPAEELCTGALAMLDAGVLDGVDYALATHIRPVQDLKAGTICSGVCHSASLTLKVKIKGQSCHAARPHLGVNVIEVASAVVAGVQAIWVNPAQSWSAKCTQIHADKGATNSIPDFCEMTFDCRAITNPLMQEFRRKFERMVKLTCEAYGAEAEIEEVLFCPAAEYDEEFKAYIGRTIVDLFGEETLANDCGGGGEDFHWFKLKYPELKAAYFGLGVGARPGLHAATMHFDPVYLDKGVQMFVKVGKDLLG